MRYRPEIDGLRALAVVPVILFHAGFELFSGGFVGVDVFFVISGYLITTILIEDIENGRFSLLNFYERRARRILPALYFLLLMVAVLSTLLMSPQQLKEFGQSLIATVTFLSNMYFLVRADYWAQSSEFLPLLHTWSLAVEEQYYLVFPIFLFLAWRYSKSKIFWMIFCFSILSLLLSEWGSRSYPLVNFYVLLTRAWELLAGSMAAFIVQRKGVKENNALAALGLSLILFSIFTYEKNTPFPSLYALPPVVGVVLLILYADSKTLVAKFLSIKVFVGIGLISYSAYLWHQPLFAFARIYKTSIDISFSLTICIIGATFLFSALSFRYVESPFRTKCKISTKALSYFAILPLIVFIIYGFYLHNTQGLRAIKMSFLSLNVTKYLDALDDEKIKRKELWAQLLGEAEKPFNNTDKLKFLFIGDSLSEDLFVVTKTSKKLDSLITPRRLAFDDECAKHIVTKGREVNHNGKLCADSISSYLKSDLFADADVIVIAAAWQENARYLTNLLSHSLLKNKKIIVYQPFAFNDIYSILYSLDSASDDLLTSDNFLFINKRSRTEFANKAIRDIALNYKIPTFNGFDAFCNAAEQKCSLFGEYKNPFIIDPSHLSISGISFFEKWFTNEIINLIKIIKKNE